MTALALNLLALLIVVGLCWGVMMWLSGRFHGHPTADIEMPWVSNLDSLGVSTGDQPCGTCEGVGAQNSDGKLTPCPECYGTGVLH